MKQYIRLALLAIATLLVVASISVAQPVTIAWRPPTGCSANDVIKWNGSAWTCGTAGATYTAGDGLTLTANDFDITHTSDFTITADQLDLSTAVTAPGTLGVAGNTTLDGNLILTQAGTTYIYGSLATSSGNKGMVINAAGTGEIQINSGTGGFTNAGTGGLGIYPGGSSTTRAIWLKGNGDAIINGGATLGDAATDSHTINGEASFVDSGTSTSIGSHEAILRVYNSSATTGNWEGIVFGATARAAIEAKNVNLASNYADLAMTTRDADGWAARLYVESDGQVYIGDTSLTSVANNVGTVTTVANTGTFSTDLSTSMVLDVLNDQSLSVISHDGYGARIRNTVDLASTGSEAIGDTVNLYGALITLDPDRASCEVCPTTNAYGLRITATTAGMAYAGGASQTAYGLYVDDATATNWTTYSVYVAGGATYLGGTLRAVGAVTFDSTLNGQGAADFDSTLNVDGNATLYGSANTIGNSATDLTTFSNGPRGINLYQGTSFEFTDDWHYRTLGNGAIPSIYYVSGVGSSDGYDAVGRPGVVSVGTSTTTSGTTNITTNASGLAFSQNSETTYEWVGGFPTLSTAGEEYSFIVGFWDTVNSINEVDGCYFLYDRSGGATDPGTGDATGTPGDYWQIWCASNSTRTGYKLDTTSNAEDSFARVISTVAAVTWPSTNVYRLKVVLEGTTKARFYINNVEVGRITTNIPSTTSRLTGSGFQIRKSAGTTARTADTDFTRLAYTMSSARS
jgi:hypothetical protein